MHKHCTINCDARSIPTARRKKLTNVRWSGKSPEWVLPLDQPHSCPDILLTNASSDGGQADGVPSLAVKQQAWIHILELKYAPDLEIHRKARDNALAQHKGLQEALLDAGWGTVTIHPVMIGNAGTITSASIATFTQLGVSSAASVDLAKELAIGSIRRTADIKRARVSHAAGGPASRQTADCSTPSGHGPDAGGDRLRLATAPAEAGGDQGQPAETADLTGTVNSVPCHNAGAPAAAACPDARPQDPATAPAPCGDGQWRIVTRSNRSSNTLRVHVARMDAQPLCCSQGPDAMTKRLRRSYTVLSGLPEDDTAGEAEAAQSRRRPKRSRPAASDNLAAPASMAPLPGSGPVPADVTALQTDEAPSPGVLPSAHGPAPIVYTDVMSSFYTNTSPCDTATQPCTGAAPVPAIRQDDVRSPRQRRKPNATALSAAEPSRAPGPFRTRRLSGNCQCNCKRGAGRHRRQHSSHYGAAFAGALFIRFSILRIRQPMLDMSSSRARAQIIHSPVFHLTMGEPGHDVECCLCVCAGLCCVCAQVPAFPVMIGKMVTMPHPS